MVKRRPEGIEALKPPVPDIQEITLLDWYAGFALFNTPPGPQTEKAQYAFELAEQMLAERKKRI